MTLTQKQENFCLKYVETGNASEAYRFAYNAEKMKPETVNSKAYLLLQKDEIRARVEELKAMAVSATIMTREEALERLSMMARVKITDIAEFTESAIGEDENGDPVMGTTWRILNSDDIPEHAAASIKSVTATKFGPKLEMHDPQSAIQQLAKMQGWEAAAKFDHSSKDGTMSPQSVDQSVVAALASKLVD